jgi:hypothetical protein
MAAEYQRTDWRIIDYRLFELDPELRDVLNGPPLGFRGPRPPSLDPGSYFVTLGAAQTFGRFCSSPFPSLLGERIGLPVLNLSRGGAGPSFFSSAGPVLDRYLEGARFVVLQIMSARSEGNSMFASDGLSYLRDRRTGVYLGCDKAYAALLREQPASSVTRVVAETRANWYESYLRLLRRIPAPKVLLWISTRRPRYRAQLDSLSGLFGAYPQLVDEQQVGALRGDVDAYVEIVTRRGLPQPLLDRFTGAPASVTDPWTSETWTENWYYPSPEMHLSAAAALEPVCRGFLDPHAPCPSRSSGPGRVTRWLTRWSRRA